MLLWPFRGGRAHWGVRVGAVKTDICTKIKKKIFVAAVLSWWVEKEEKLLSTFPCCWSSGVCSPQHPLYFSAITRSSPSRRGAERAASPHTQPLPPKYLSQIDDVVQGPWLTTCAWTPFPHGSARIRALAFGANDLAAINIYLQYVDS